MISSNRQKPVGVVAENVVVVAARALAAAVSVEVTFGARGAVLEAAAACKGAEIVEASHDHTPGYELISNTFINL